MGTVMGDKSISFRSLFAALLALALIGCGDNHSLVTPLNNLRFFLTTFSRMQPNKQLKPTVKHMALNGLLR